MNEEIKNKEEELMFLRVKELNKKMWNAMKGFIDYAEEIGARPADVIFSSIINSASLSLALFEKDQEKAKELIEVCCSHAWAQLLDEK